MLSFWGFVSGIEALGDNLLKFTTPAAGDFLVQRRLTLTKPPGPTPPSLWMKYLSYVEKAGEKRVYQVENRAVDAIPFDPGHLTYYLIRRGDSGLLALPGGFIDVGDGINSQPVEIVLKRAAARELMEETTAVADEMKPLGLSLREVINPATNQVTREGITRTWPFAALMVMRPLVPSDDAAQAPGEQGLPPGWYRLSSPLPEGFHFSHHLTILQRLKQAVSIGWHKAAKLGERLKGKDRTAAARMGRNVKSATLHDYDRIAAGKTPIFLVNDGKAIDVETLSHR